MTLDPLATSADLTAHGITSDGDDAAALAAASTAIRTAADHMIGPQKTSTVTLDAPRGRLLRLPGPIASVDSVTVNGEDWTPGTDYLVVAEGLYSTGPSWASSFVPPYGYTFDQPMPVVVTFTHGLVTIPEDIVDLCCTLAGAWKRAKASGFVTDPGIESVRVDDYAETRTPEAAGQVSPLWIPESTRDDLRSRFGGGATSAEMG